MADPTPTTTRHKPKRLVGVSTKAYFLPSRTQSYATHIVQALLKRPHLHTHIDIFLLPDFLSLSLLSTLSASLASPGGTPLLYGAQNVHHAPPGAFTGEISAAALAELGCRFVEMGHAERRRLFGETDESTALKASAVSAQGMVPLVCVGEVGRGGVDDAVRECRGQVESVLDAVPADSEVVFAYEPVWAIGAEKAADSDYVVGVVRGLRGAAVGHGGGRKGVVRFLYGGSAGPGVWEGLKEELDGLFLGRFAHDPEKFLETIEEVAASSSPMPEK